MTEYLYGKTTRLGNTFKNIAGDEYDPDTISLTIYDAEGGVKETVTLAAADIKKTSVGVYYYDYDIPSDSTSQGYWMGVWTSVISSQTDVSEEQFYVRPPVEKLYVSIDGVKNALMSSGVTMDNDDIRIVIRESMAEVDAITGRSFMNGNTETEWFSTNQSNPNNVVNTLFLTYLPVQSVTSLKEYNTSKELVTTYTSDDYWVDDNGILELTTSSFVHQRNRVECVYTYGYTSVPLKVSKLCSVITQIEVMRNYMIAQDDKIVGFSVPEISQIQLGETYMTARLAIDQLEKQKKALVAEIGNLRNSVFVI